MTLLSAQMNGLKNHPDFRDSSVGKESTCNAGDPSSIPGSRRVLFGLEEYSSTLWLNCDSAGKESACNAGDVGLIPGLGGYPEEGKGYSL